MGGKSGTQGGVRRYLEKLRPLTKKGSGKPDRKKTSMGNDREKGFWGRKVPSKNRTNVGPGKPNLKWQGGRILTREKTQNPFSSCPGAL